MRNGRWAAALGVAVAAVLAGGTARAQDKTDMSAYYDPGFSGFQFHLYCDDAVVDDAETKDLLTASFWNGDTLLSVVPHIGVDCNVWWNPSAGNVTFIPWHLDDQQNGATAHRFTHMIIETEGSDAFFIDWASLTQDATGRKIAQWGAPGGRGFCLSRDPNDIAGDWAGHSDTCDSALWFDVASGQVYEAQPVNLSEYAFYIDCTHSGMDKTGNESIMTFEVYDANERLLAQASRPGEGLNCLRDDGTFAWMFAFQGPRALPTGSPAYVQIKTQGGIRLFDRYFIDQMWATRDGIEIARWGRNEGMGWCLSRSPDLWTGVWQQYSAGGCFGGLQFNLDTLQTYSIQ
jgi:hypothetical protein